jgi:FKBP-type peptidyl-prolyl cis-trans isomerase FkpA
MTIQGSSAALKVTGVHVSALRSIRSLIVPVAIGLLLGVTGCTKSPTTPAGFEPFSRTDLRVGTGTAAVNGATVSVNYTGWLYDSTQADKKGLQFDTSTGVGPFTFTIGAGQVIQGFDLGVAGMNVGGLRRVIVPPGLAYGDTRYGNIPQNATLVFEIELLEVQ